MYCDDDMLMLSGIQHFRFCPRQWALIHLDQKWDENRLTTEGEIQHKRVDDPFYRQKCGDWIVLRSVNLASYELGLYGVADIIELRPCDDAENSIMHPKYPGKWMPVPVEYKHGKNKQNEIDEVQLVAQAMCLEEMYSINVSYGSFFYWELRHRIDVETTPRLRDIVRKCSNEMHEIFKKGILPNASLRKSCKNCSLSDICMPQIENCSTVNQYLNRYLFE